jgi:hypothetical protein
MKAASEQSEGYTQRTAPLLSKKEAAGVCARWREAPRRLPSETAAAKILGRMRNNPRGWRIDEVAHEKD